MKTQEHRNEDLQHSRYEADLGASINALFLRCPTLRGFAVRGAARLSRDGFALQRASGLFVTDVSIYPLCGLDTAVTFCDEIVAALTELIDECPEARELLQERTFARVLH
jgi:hypothetical protein